jgi:tripartite-type tricarboxylate transporter receptor subunit TctC
MSPRLAFLLASLLAAAQAAAQPYPVKPVKLTAPYSAGAGPAVFMRIVAEKLTKYWEQQVIVDSRPGASGFIAIDAVKNAPADGYELLVAANSHMTVNPAIFRDKLPYDPQKDFAPVATVFLTPFFITVKSDGPFSGVPALIAAAKAGPGALTYGGPYVGSPSHLGGADFEYRTGTKMTFVPYKDQSQMYVSIANGELSWAFSTIGSALPLLKAGRLKLLAIGAKQRSASAPDVPTVGEAGGPQGLEVLSWMALFAPRATSAEIIGKVNAGVARALGEPDVLERMKSFGFEPFISSPAQLAELIRTDTKANTELVQRIGVKPQ